MILVEAAAIFIAAVLLTALSSAWIARRLGAGIGGTWGVLPFLALPVSIGFVEDASNVDAYQGHMFKVAPTIFAAQLALLPWYATPARLPSNWSPGAVIACTMALSSTVGGVATRASALAMDFAAEAPSPLMLPVLATMLLCVPFVVATNQCCQPYSVLPVAVQQYSKRTALFWALLPSAVLVIVASLCHDNNFMTLLTRASYILLVQATMAACHTMSGVAIQIEHAATMTVGLCSHALYFLLATFTQYGSWVNGAKKPTMFAGAGLAIAASCCLVGFPVGCLLHFRDQGRPRYHSIPVEGSTRATGV